jgi:hypothetical protein
MKKQLIIVGIISVLLCIGLSGCTTTNNKQNNETEFFVISGTISNYLANESFKVKSIEFDYMVFTEGALIGNKSAWQDSVIGIHLIPNDVKDFSIHVKKGYSKYYFMASWQTIIGEHGTSHLLNFTNSNFDDIDYNIFIHGSGDIEII